MKLGLPCALSLLVEWGSFELNAAIVGQISIDALATHSVYAQYSAVFYCLPTGFAQAAATLASNALGAGRPHVARRLAPLSYGCTLACGLLQGGVALFLRRSMGALFSSDSAVIALVDYYAPILCIVYEMSDVWKCAGMILLRGTGRPNITLWTVAVSCLLLGLPLSFGLGLGSRHLGFLSSLGLGPDGMGLWGVWLGMSLGWYASGTVFAAVVWRTDWSVEARKAAERAAEEKKLQAQAAPPGGANQTPAAAQSELELERAAV